MTDSIQKKREAKKGIMITSRYDERYEFYEIHLDDKPLMVCDTKEQADTVVEVIHEAYEDGYLNGLLLGFEDKEKTREALVSRGVLFGKTFSFDE